MFTLRISKSLFLFGDKSTTWNKFGSPFSWTWGGILSIHLFDNPLFWVYLHVGQSPMPTYNPSKPRPHPIKSGYNLGKLGRFHLRVLATGDLQISLSESDRLDFWEEVIQRRDAGYTDARIERYLVDEIENWSRLNRGGDFIATIIRPEHGLPTDATVIARNPGFDSDENEYEYRTLTDCDGMWWYPEYRPNRLVDEMCQNGEVILESAP